jgi:hypothetical protein
MNTEFRNVLLIIGIIILFLVLMHHVVHLPANVGSGAY